MDKGYFFEEASNVKPTTETPKEFEGSRKLYLAGNILNFDYNKLEEAEQKYREAMQKTSDYGVYYHLAQGQIYILNGKLDDGLTEFEIASEINTKIEDVHINLGLTYRKLSGRYRSFGMSERAEQMTQESITAFKRALDINPNNPVVYSTMAMTFSSMGDMKSAEACAKKTLEYDPENYIAYTSLAQVSRTKGEIEEAKKLALKAIEINPHQHFAYSFLGARKNKNLPPLEPKPKIAIEWLYKALERAPKDRFVISELAKTHGMELQQYDEALKYYNKLAELEFAESDYGLYANRGQIFLQMGKLDSAEKDLKKSLTIRSDFGFALSTLMKLRREQGRHEEALEVAKKLPDTFQNQKQLKEIEALFSKDYKESFAITYELTDKPDRVNVAEASVRDRLEKALKFYSKNYEAWGLLGLHYTAQKNYQQAKKCLQKAISLDEKAFNYHTKLAFVLENLKEWRAAEREYKLVNVKSPKYIPARQGLDRVQKQLRQESRGKAPDLFDGDKIVFLNSKSGREEQHPIKLIRGYLYDRMNDWKLPIREIIEDIGKDPVFIIAKTGVGKTVTVPTKVLLELCDQLIKESVDLSRKFPQVYVVEPRIPICTMTMAEMNDGYQKYLAYQMIQFPAFQAFLGKNGVKNLQSKDRDIMDRIIELAFEYVKTGKAPYNPEHFNLYGCITSVTGKVNANAPILFITTGIMESMTFDGQKLDPKYHRIIIDEAHVTIEANPSIELGIALARKRGVKIDYMSATVDPATLEKDLGVRIVYAGTQRFPIYLTNMNRSVSDGILDIVENFLLNPDPNRFPDPNSFRDPKTQQDIKRVCLHLLSKDDFKENGKSYPGLSNRPQGLLVIVNSHQSENSDTRKIADIISQAEFNKDKKRVHVLRLASPVVRDPTQKLVFDRMIEKIERENGRYVIVATNVVEMGLTFSSLDYVITMDSEFFNEFVDGGQMITKVALGINALYQRIGRAGRVRPGIAFIAEDFGATYCKYDDETLARGLPVEPVRYPIRKGSFLKLAIYSFRERIPESHLKKEIASLRLPSRIHEDHQLWTRFLEERRRLQKIGIASKEALSPYGNAALTFIGLDDMDFAKLLATVIEKYGNENDLVIIFTLLAASSELGFANLVDEDFVIINPRTLSLSEAFHQDKIGIEISEAKELINTFRKDVNSLNAALLKRGVDREIAHDICDCLRLGYQLSEEKVKDTSEVPSSFEENPVEITLTEDEGEDKNSEFIMEDYEHLQSLLNKLFEHQNRDMLLFSYSAVSLSDQSEFINIWRVYRYFFNKYFSYIRSRTLNSMEVQELRRKMEKEADRLQLVGRSLNGLNKRFLDLSKHVKISIPKEETPLPSELQLDNEEYELLVEVCIQELLFERLGDNEHLELCLNLFETFGINGNFGERDFSEVAQKLREQGFETNGEEIKKLWFLIIHEAQRRIREEATTFQIRESREVLPLLTKRMEEELLQIVRDNGYHRKLTFTKGHFGFETKVRDQDGKEITLMLPLVDNPLAPALESRDKVSVFAKLQPMMITVAGEDSGVTEMKKEKGFRISHVTIVD